MSIVVLLEFRVTVEALEDTMQFFKKILPDTRAFPGCEGLDVFSDADEPTKIIFYERWQTQQHYQKYSAWRTETGSMDEFAKKLVGPPSLRYLNRHDV